MYGHPLQRSKCQRYRFSLLIQELQHSSTEEYSACIVAFINCILAGAEDLDERIKLRNEFICKYITELGGILTHDVQFSYI